MKAFCPPPRSPPPSLSHTHPGGVAPFAPAFLKEQDSTKRVFIIFVLLSHRKFRISFRLLFPHLESPLVLS